MLGMRRAVSRFQSTATSVWSPGIVGMEVYIPNSYVDQDKLEAYEAAMRAAGVSQVSPRGA